MSLCRLPIELHAQSWAGRRQQVPVLPLWLNRDYVGQKLSWPVGLLLHAEVGTCEVQVQAGGRRDRPEWVVNGELYVVGFAHGGYLLRFGDAPSDTQVNASVVYPLLLHELLELPFGAELLPGGQGYGGAKPQHLVGSGVFRTQGIFDKEGTQRLDFAAEPK